MTSPEPAPPADPTSYRRRGFGFGFWAMMVLCLLCVIGGVFIARFLPTLFPVDPKSAIILPAIAPGKSSSPETPEVAVESPPPAPPAPAAAPAGADLAGLKARVEHLEQGQSRTVQTANTALATAALLQAAQTSRPFVAELAQVARLLPESPDVAALRELAQTGAPARAVLAVGYDAAASSAIAAVGRPGPNASLLQRIRYAISSIVTVRRVGDAKGKSPSAILARAEQLAENGDIEHALEELAGLPAPARQAMGPWIEKARARVDIDRHLANIRAASVKALNSAEAAS